MILNIVYPVDKQFGRESWSYIFLNISQGLAHEHVRLWNVDLESLLCNRRRHYVDKYEINDQSSKNKAKQVCMSGLLGPGTTQHRV